MWVVGWVFFRVCTGIAVILVHPPTQEPYYIFHFSTDLALLLVLVSLPSDGPYCN